MPTQESAAVPAPREDPNSMLAHQQLVAKAKAGRIDLYFLGDSITRRWGCTDPQWAELHKHWKQNFHGWNAANFGWGGDRVENIHWRILNGELDGANPKVIVLLAGTNNIGAAPADDEKIDDIVKGINALLKTCRDKAPRATIVLMGIFPRNDNMAAMPAINRINEQLAKRADGNTIRFLNINDKLADTNGRLHDGVTIDQLHLSLSGYEIWADALRPVLTELLGPRGAEDFAPPATGDPSAQ